MELRRELKFFDFLCLGVNSIVGSGIFLFPGLMMAQMGPASIVSFLLTGVLLIPAALCFARLAARYDATGGPCLYAEDAFGPWVGFGVGWICWVTNVLSYAAVANAISTYLAHFWAPMSGVAATKMVAAVVILLLGWVNFIGVKPAARTSDTFTVAKLIPLVLFAVIGLFYLDSSRFTPFAPHGWAPLGSSLFLAFFAFQGFEVVPVPAGESGLPKRDVPRATILSLLGCMILYVWIQTVVVGTYPALAGSEKPLAEAASLFLGPLAGIIAIGAAVSTIGFTTGAALGGPRYLYALGATRHFPKILLKLHPKYGTPYVAIVIQTLTTLVLAMTMDFLKLVDLSIVTLAFQYVVTCAACAWLLHQWLIPTFGIVAVVWLSSQARIEEIVASLVALGAGYVLALLYTRWKPATAVKEGEGG